MKVSRLIIILTILVAISCQTDTSSKVDRRPHDPWIFRSVLDGHPRMVTLALDVNLWTAYSTENCALYQAWKGVVQFEGAVYDTQHGPQPLSVGEKYVVNAFQQPWLLVAEGDTIKLEGQYKGHKVVNDHAVLMYELGTSVLDEPIYIEERVEASTNENGQAEFLRTFNVSGVNEGHTILLKTNFSSIVVKSNIETDGSISYTREGQIKADDVTTLDLDGVLKLNSNTSTFLKVTFMINPVITNPNYVEVEEDQGDDIPPGLQYIAKSDCKTCHNKNLQTIGPSYTAIADRYSPTEDNITLLMSKIKNGGSGIWGNQVMTPHPELSDSKLRAMTAYILSLADREEAVETDGETKSFDPIAIEENNLILGLIVKVYLQRSGFQSFDDIRFSGEMHQAGILPNLANISGGDFTELSDDFALTSSGYLKVQEEGKYSFRIWSDDGSRLFLNNELFLDNDGMHGTVYKEGTAYLKPGYYPVRVDYFQGGGGKFLSFNWKPVGAGEFETVPAENLFHDINERSNLASYSLPMGVKSNIPGDGNLLTDVHPGFDLFQARPSSFTPKVGGMDFFSDGRLAISTWDPEGAVYILDNLKAEDPEDIIVTKVASGLAEPLGLKIVDDEIYIMQKQELTHLVDNNGDGLIDEYRTVCDDWRVSSNFHEFGFGLEYKDGYFYASLATAIDPGGASTQPQIPDRGKVIKMSKDDGSLEFIASGLRTPNGIGWGYNGELFVCDNQGDWLPSSKVLHVTEGAWFGSRSVDPEGSKKLTEKKPVVWLPQDEIGNSPSTPSYIDVGAYKGQMIHGEVTNGGIKRVYVEEVEGQLQGALFRFSQGLEAGVNRISWSPDGDLYIGGIGNPGNWSQSGKLRYGLQRLSYNGNPAFEMLAIRAKSDGLEIEFTEPLAINEGWDAQAYEVNQWYYLPTEQYGGPKMDFKSLKVLSVNVSDDRKRVFLELDGMKEDHVIYVHISEPFPSENNRDLWSTEAWYTMNKIPVGVKGFRADNKPVIVDNELTDEERAEGWILLFDGKSTNGWRNFKKETIGSSWKVADGILFLDSQRKDDGGWQAADGGDIITDKSYENFDFRAEWKISNCGNSGIMFNVVEDEKYNYVWETGPEMQILDNTCHPDTKYPTHRAGDLYDMIETKYVTVNPAGEWNKVRILSDGGNVQFWLNGYNVVDFEMHTAEWKERIANSKFKDMPDFGLARSGHISLQDHGDPVFFKNIKIREL